jgi:hypothetical protein
MKRLLFFFTGLIFLCNCNREEPSKVVILVTTNDTLSNVKTGDILLFHIHSSAVEDVVKNVTISSFDPQYGSVLILDTLINLQNFKFDYQYIVPQYNDTVTTELVFTAFSPNRLSTSSYKTFFRIAADNPIDTNGQGDGDTVIIDDGILAFHGSLILYGCSYQTQNGFNLGSTLSNVIHDSLMDIYDLCDPSDTVSFPLSRTWGSHTNISFVRFNDFDYNAATVKSVRNVYNNAITSDYIYNIESGDIIFIGRKGMVLGVIQITSIKDLPYEQDNHYMFDLKRIE